MREPILPVLDWSALSEQQRLAALQRPSQALDTKTLATVETLVARVRSGGDAALREMTQLFDGVLLESLTVTEEEFDRAEATLKPAAREALDRAMANVHRFHSAQVPAPLSLETAPGVRCERRVTPIRAVGLYVPAGTAPLPSTALMLAVPSQIAACSVRVLCTPPRKDRGADPATLYVARRCGIERVIKVGGAQAVAAMAYGTESVPKVDKIFGPGSSWVTAAKLLVSRDPAGAACDMPAGPSEVLVIADDSARSDFVAADLLAQAEHSADAQVLLVTPSRRLVSEMPAEIDRQLGRLSRRDIVRRALMTSRIILVESLSAALEVSNAYAPEHLILQVRKPREWLDAVSCAGSVFLGPWSPEPMGDYCSGTNHVLPTYGYARAYSGLSVTDFLKQITVQELSPAGLRDLGPVACALAELEGLDAHANAVTIRLEALTERGVA